MERSVSQSRDCDGRTRSSVAFHPTVEFADAEGKTRVAISTTGSSDDDHPVNIWIEIGLDPENRSVVQARLNDYPVIALAFFGFLGGIFLIIGMAFLIGSIRNRGEPVHSERARREMPAAK